MAKQDKAKQSTVAAKKRAVEQNDHKGKTRPHNLPVGLVDGKSDATEGKQTWAYDPYLDPTLQWAGKAERTSFEISTASSHVAAVRSGQIWLRGREDRGRPED